MWDEIQVYAVPDSFVSAPRFADRLRIWNFAVPALFLGWGGAAVEIALCFCQIRYKLWDFTLRLGNL